MLTGLKCGSLDRLVNGRIDYSGQEYLDIAYFTCNEGYWLIGSNTSVCDECGFWDPASPICQGMSILRK